jgi:DNA-binding NtrC family response regulator
MSPDDRKVRLLLVDDEVEFLNSTAKALRRRGFEVTTVQNPAIGLKLLEHETFDVAVLDVKMPGISGDQMFKEMRRRWPETPVVMLTGHGTVEQAFEISKDGVFDYLTKPCDVEKLVRTCLNAVAASLRGEMPEKEPEEPEEIDVLIVDDEEDFLHSLSTALRRRKMRVSTASSGEEALGKLETNSCPVVLLDLKMPGMDGLETLRRIKAADPSCEVLLLTGLPTVATVVEGLKDGAFDYVVKPQDMELLVRKIREAFRHAVTKAAEAHKKQVETILDHNND